MTRLLTNPEQGDPQLIQLYLLVRLKKCQNSLFVHIILDTDKLLIFKNAWMYWIRNECVVQYPLIITTYLWLRTFKILLIKQHLNLVLILNYTANIINHQRWIIIIFSLCTICINWFILLCIMLSKKTNLMKRTTFMRLIFKSRHIKNVFSVLNTSNYYYVSVWNEIHETICDFFMPYKVFIKYWHCEQSTY